MQFQIVSFIFLYTKIIMFSREAYSLMFVLTIVTFHKHFNGRRCFNLLTCKLRFKEYFWLTCFLRSCLSLINQHCAYVQEDLTTKLKINNLSMLNFYQDRKLYFLLADFNRFTEIYDAMENYDQCIHRKMTHIHENAVSFSIPILHGI